jgi:hypothetical protein
MDFSLQQDIDDLLALRASELITVSIPEVEFSRQGPRYGGHATVIRVTPLGRALAAEYLTRKAKASRRRADRPEAET